MTDKRKPGRPRVSNTEKTQPYTISLTPSEVEEIRKLGGGNLTAGIRKAIDMSNNGYPIGHKFFTYIDRGDDNPQSREEVTVTGYFKDKVQQGGYESGVVVQTADGDTTEISYAYLREDGTGH